MLICLVLVNFLTFSGLRLGCHFCHNFVDQDPYSFQLSFLCEAFALEGGCSSFEAACFCRIKTQIECWVLENEANWWQKLQICLNFLVLQLAVRRRRITLTEHQRNALRVNKWCLRSPWMLICLVLVNFLTFSGLRLGCHFCHNFGDFELYMFQLRWLPQTFSLIPKCSTWKTTSGNLSETWFECWVSDNEEKRWRKF